MKYKILFIFEGEKTEFNVVKNLTQYFVNENILIQTAYCNDIYELFKEIEEDPDLETFSLIKSISYNSKILNEFKSSDFAEIYLFFDYDGHDDQAEDKKIDKLVEFFSEETEKGKLYISYPMIESLKHFPKEGDFEDVVVPARKNIKYKQFVDTQIDSRYNTIGSYDRSTWIILIEAHLKKLNFIVNNIYELPNRTIYQDEIFSNQKEKYIIPNKSST